MQRNGVRSALSTVAQGVEPEGQAVLTGGRHVRHPGQLGPCSGRSTAPRAMDSGTRGVVEASGLEGTRMGINGRWRQLVVLALIPIAEACATEPKKGAPPTIESTAISAAVDSPDGPTADLMRDAARKPREMLAFFGIKPGMKILDLFSGGGWYAELEERVVGLTGRGPEMRMPATTLNVNTALMRPWSARSFWQPAFALRPRVSCYAIRMTIAQRPSSILR
jgi:hypothetical protein